MAGAYDVTVTNATGCTVTGVTTVVISTPPTISATTVDNPCAQVSLGAVSLQASGGPPPYTYRWNNNASGPSLSALQGGTYIVTVADSYGCSASASYIVNQGSFAVTAQQSTTINLGQSTTLTGLAAGGSNQVTYSWTPDYHLNCLGCQVTIASPYQTIVYRVEATDTNGCSGYDTVTVTVIPLHTVYIPNAFTPNGDGNNDVFSVYGDLGLLTYLHAKVFDRWGELVFESNDINFAWDGTFKGKKEVSQVFVYEIKVVFLDGYSPDLYKGSLTLLR